MTAGVQQDWVLLSASADHENLNLNPSINDPELINFRELNTTNPALLYQDLPRKTLFPVKKKLAILLLASLDVSKEAQSFSKLADQVDIFIVTTSKYENVANSNFPRDKVTIVDHIPAEQKNEAMLPVASMKQWHKSALA